MHGKESGGSKSKPGKRKKRAEGAMTSCLDSIQVGAEGPQEKTRRGVKKKAGNLTNF